VKFEEWLSPVKTRSQELKIEKKLVNTEDAAVLIQNFLKLVRKVVLTISRSSLKMVISGQKLGHRGLK
jgi:hypothetical protein